jgi:DNA polymerase III epsilon subunit-like protein
MQNQTLRLDQNDFFYQETAVPVIDDIMELLLALKKPGRKSLQYIWDYPIDPDVWFDLWEDIGYALYDVNIVVRLTDYDPEHPGWNIDGEAGFTESAGAQIDIDIQLSSENFGNPEVLAKLETELYNVVPHEMHHLTQNDQPFQRVSCPITASSKNPGSGYFTSSCEVPAFVIGFRGEASKSGRPVAELMSAYLDNQIKANKITSKEAEEIKRTWLSHSSWSKKDMNESIIREYVRELLSESRLSGQTIQGVLELLESHVDNTWVFFDTETTGFNPNSGQLTEIGAVAVDPKSWNADASILGEFNEKVKLDSDTLKTITQQSNNPEDVKGKSVQDLLSMTRYGERGKQYKDEQEVLDNFFEFISSFPNPMLVAQNAAFDMKFVNVRSGGKIPKYPVLDTQQLMQGYLIPLLKTQAKAEEGDPQARKLLNKLYVRKGNWGYYSASMGVVSKAYGISIDEWHNALADVKMMMEMYRSVVETIRKGMNADISKEQGKFLAYQRKRKKNR